MWDTFYATTEGSCSAPTPHPARSGSCASAVRADPGRVPGMCYRYEQITAAREIQFHQWRGLAWAGNITMTDLKGTLISCPPHVRSRAAGAVRASYFPFTSPAPRWTSSA